MGNKLPMAVGTASIAAAAAAAILGSDPEYPCSASKEVPLPAKCCQGPEVPLPDACCVEGHPQPELCTGPCDGPHCPIPPPDCAKTSCEQDFNCCSLQQRLQEVQIWARTSLALDKQRPRRKRSVPLSRAMVTRITAPTRIGNVWSPAHRWSQPITSPLLLPQPKTEPRSRRPDRAVAFIAGASALVAGLIAKASTATTAIVGVATTSKIAAAAAAAAAAAKAAAGGLTGGLLAGATLAGLDEATKSISKRAATWHDPLTLPGAQAATPGTPNLAAFVAALEKLEKELAASPHSRRTKRSPAALLQFLGRLLIGVKSKIVSKVPKVVGALKGAPKKLWSFSLNGLATAAGFATIQGFLAAMSDKNDFNNVIFAHVGEECWKQCYMKNGFCAFCGHQGRCCRQTYTGNGCSGVEGDHDRHVCIADPTLVDDLKQAYETIILHVYASNSSSPQHDEFIRQLTIADSIRNRGDVSTIQDRPTDIENILAGGQFVSPARIAGFVSDLQAAFNHTSRRKRSTLAWVRERIKTHIRRHSDSTTPTSRHKRSPVVDLETAHARVLMEANKREPDASMELFKFKLWRHLLKKKRQQRQHEEAQKRRKILEHRRRNSRASHRLPPQLTGLRRERRDLTEAQAEAQRIADFLDSHCTPLFPREYHKYFHNHTYVCTLDYPHAVALPVTVDQFKNRFSSLIQSPAPLEEGLRHLNKYLFPRRKRAAEDDGPIDSRGKRPAQSSHSGAPPAKQSVESVDRETTRHSTAAFSRAYVEALTDNQVYKSMQERDMPSGPVGPTTRDLYNRRLAAELEAKAQAASQPDTSSKTGTKHRCRRDTTCRGNTKPRFHMLAGDGRLDDVLAALGTEALPESYMTPLYAALATAFYAPEGIFTLDYRLQQVQDSLNALHYVTHGGPRPPQWRINAALHLMSRLHNKDLLKLMCGTQRDVERHNRRVTGCEFKQALISNYMTPLDFPRYPRLPPQTTLTACSELINKGGFPNPLTDLARTPCASPIGEMSLLNYITEHAHRRKRAAFQPPHGAFDEAAPPQGRLPRDPNGLHTAGREHEGRGFPHRLPSCEDIVRAPAFNQPLTNLAITNCMEPRRWEVVTVLWYLADQAHLLHINMRNLRFLPPQGPGHHDPRPGPRPPRPDLSPPRARRTAPEAGWDPLRFPAAEGADLSRTPHEWVRPPRHAQPTTEEEHQKASFRSFMEPTTLRKQEGGAATDVILESVGISCPLQHISMTIHQVLAINRHRLQGVFGDDIPEPLVWRVDNPDIPADVVRFLLERDRAIQLNRRWIRHIGTMATSLSELTRHKDAPVVKRSAANPDEEAHDALLARAAIDMSTDAWEALQHGSIHNQHLTFTARNHSFTVPCENATFAIETVNREIDGTRSRRATNTLATETLSNYLFSWVTRDQSRNAHLRFAASAATTAGKAIQRFIYSGKGTLTRVSEDLNKAFTRHKETWDGDALVSDALDTTAGVINTMMEMTSGAARGSFHMKHLSQLPWPTIEAKYEAAKMNGYKPLFDTPAKHATAQATLSVIREGDRVIRFDILVWLPLIHEAGDMTAYRIIRTPMHINDDSYITLAPRQERIILESRHNPDRWIALSAGEFASCRPTGNYRTCDTIRTTRPPIEDQIMAQENSDICAYAIHTGKPRLAVSACQIDIVQEEFWAKAVAPATWLVFSREQTTVDVECPGSPAHDRTRRPRVRGVGLLRLPPACRANFAGWELISGNADMAQSNTAVDGMALAALKEAFIAARNLTGQAAATEDDKTQPEGFDLAAEVAGRLSARKAQAAPYTELADTSCEIYVLPTLGAVSTVIAAILITLCKLYRDIRTRCSDNTDGINRLRDRPDLNLKEVKKHLRDCDRRVETIKHQTTGHNQRFNQMEESANELRGLYNKCHDVATKAKEFLQEQQHKAPHQRGRHYGPYQLEFGPGTKH